MQETQERQVQSLGGKDLLEKGMATHSDIPAWRIPWAEEPGGLQSMELQRVGHDWVTNRFYSNIWAFQVAQWVKNLRAMQETQAIQVWFLGWEDLLEEGISTHSSILAWRIPWTEEPSGLQFMDRRVGYDWSDWTHACIVTSTSRVAVKMKWHGRLGAKNNAWQAEGTQWLLAHYGDSLCNDLLCA